VRSLLVSAVGLAIVILVGCAPGRPSTGSLSVVTTGPYPLYQREGEWLATRLSGLPLAEIDDRIISEARLAQAQRKESASDGPWLHLGCLFEIQRQSPDEQDTQYVWAYGRVVRCDEPVVRAVLEPQMGMRPREVRIYDGLVGYFPARMLEPYAGATPAPRR
jgi:hypothetical protein